MAGTDYDAPRVKPEEQAPDEALEEARAKVAPKGDKVDDEPNLDDGVTLPGADLSGVELEVEVAPERADEFTCMSCFLINHRSQLAAGSPDHCLDCA
ncbi:hypothetical protein ASC77_09605 [Nocardioides sp. Root1257]|uniref:DUF4193 family protein n=1 Tax=unclassified Nocardioides TaxID=2615069 RepID=UPI0006F67EE1|nr:MULTISPECIES: DUF4193 family protein [unclassified Nocardioides]KQW48960.1 hypothetical protein ASC77_09605 [Nocardioides sp. Root1257]KRC48134.1 hypothetical protein ASE24_09610 [Nocardioides sp. Root224]